MPRLSQPTNDSERLYLLRTSLDAGTQGRKAGRPRLSQGTLTRLSNVIERFEGAMRGLVDADAANRAANQQAEATRKGLEVEMQTIWQRLRVQLRRGLVSPALVTYYAMDQRGRARLPQRQESVFQLARQLVQGDSEAQAAGYPG